MPQGSMNGEVRWTDEDGYSGITGGGKEFAIYGENSPSPMEMVLHAHACCSLIDVIGGLKHRIDGLRGAKIEIDAERAEEQPRVFTSVTMNYILEGDVPEELVRRIIASSHEKLCSVGIMITRSGATLNWDVEIHP